MKKRLNFLNNVHIILFILTAMFLISVCDNLRGPYSIQIKNYFEINNTQLSLIYIVSSLSYMLFATFSGFLCSKIGHKNSICIGFVTIILSIVKISLSFSFADFLIGLFIINAGEALVLVGINTIIPLLDIKYKALVMNLLHFS